MNDENMIAMDREMLVELLATALEDQSGLGPGYFDKETLELLDEDDVPEHADTARFIKIVPRPAGEPYERMKQFVATIGDAKAKKALSDALEHDKPFRAFKDALRLYPIFEEEWIAFKDKEQSKMVEQWLAEHGVTLSLR